MSDELLIPCSFAPGDDLRVEESDAFGDARLYICVSNSETRDVLLNIAGVTALRDRCDAFIREHGVQHTSNDIADSDRPESIAAPVTHFDVIEGE